MEDHFFSCFKFIPIENSTGSGQKLRASTLFVRMHEFERERKIVLIRLSTA